MSNIVSEFQDIKGLYDSRIKDWQKGLSPMGKLFYRLHLIEYDFIFDDIDLTLWYYVRPWKQFFCRHEYQRPWKIPDEKKGERGHPDKCGCVRQDHRECIKCWKVEFE